MAWFAYCKGCNLRFTLQQQPAQESEQHLQKISLPCPYCGHTDQYTPADLLRAMEASSVQ